MRVLAISSAYIGCSACIVADGTIVALARSDQEHGLAAALPAMVSGLLDQAGRALDLVAVAVGPGSFTGLRAGISVATGIGLGLGLPVMGVTVAEAFGEILAALDGRSLWVAIEARSGRVFIDAGQGAHGYATNALPQPAGRIAIAGNAANFVAGALAARGADVKLTAARVAGAAQVAAIGVKRHQGLLPPLAPLPIYVDAPEAKRPAGGLREAPM